MIILAILVLSFLFRLIPHIPNFTPLLSLAVFCGGYIDKKYSYILPLLLYVASDLIIGLHGVIFFTWGSIFLIALGAKFFLNPKKTYPKRQISSHKTSFFSTIFYTIFASLFFFIVTNFGVWFAGWYPHNWTGLWQCYINALPFFRISLLGDIFFVSLLAGAYNFAFAKIVSPRWKFALFLT